MKRPWRGGGRRGLFSQTKREIEKTDNSIVLSLSYLIDRCQFVSIGNTSSTYNQSFVLSPRVQFLFDFHLFADDSNLFSADLFLECLETRVNQEFKNVHDWFCASTLSLSIDRTNFVVV